MRTEKCLPSDLALTVCWEETSNTVTALLHGCTLNESKQIHRWLDKAKDALKHPLLPAVAMTEIQPERHGSIYRTYHARYTALFEHIRAQSEQIQTEANDSLGPGKLEITSSLTQIFRMYQKHHNFYRLLTSFCRILDTLVEMSSHHLDTLEDYNIKARLGETAHAYKDLVEQSKILADGKTLLLNTVSLLPSPYIQSEAAFGLKLHAIGVKFGIAAR